MRVLLIQPHMNWPQIFADSPSQALLTLGTLAHDRGHEVKILHLDIDRINILYEIDQYLPDIVGITVNTFQVKSAREIAWKAKQKDVRVIIGGPHACVWDGEGEVVVGEGENAWLEILGEKPDIETINDIPPLNYDLVDVTRFSGIPPIGAYPQIAIMASRGCPNSCTFCNTPVFWGKKVRYRQPKLVVDEVENLHFDYGIKEVYFQDDTFNLNHPWAIDIFNEIITRKLNKEMLFRITSRVNEKLVTEEFLNIAREAGVWNIFYGVESGSQVMLDRMKKGITVEEVRRAFEMTKKAHIHTQASFIVGLPGETVETLLETQKLIQEINPNLYGWCYACPFPNTELDREVRAEGHIKEKDYGDYAYGDVLVRTDALTFDDLSAFMGFSKGD